MQSHLSQSRGLCIIDVTVRHISDPGAPRATRVEGRALGAGLLGCLWPFARCGLLVVEGSLVKSRIFVLTGPSGSGKTTTCRRWIALAQQRGLDCAGILCPARFEDKRKTGIDLLDVRTGERCPLAHVDDQPADLRIGPFRFDTQAMSRAKAILDAACPCDVLIVDEIGPLELERGQGWVNALELLRAGRFRVAVAVVRPRLVEAFCTAVGELPLSVLTMPGVLAGKALSVPPGIEVVTIADHDRPPVF
jgi:nucleoside-triphosphatase THEP1